MAVAMPASWKRRLSPVSQDAQPFSDARAMVRLLVADPGSLSKVLPGRFKALALEGRGSVLDYGLGLSADPSPDGEEGALAELRIRGSLARFIALTGRSAIEGLLSPDDGQVLSVRDMESWERELIPPPSAPFNVTGGGVERATLMVRDPASFCRALEDLTHSVPPRGISQFGARLARTQSLAPDGGAVVDLRFSGILAMDFIAGSSVGNFSFMQHFLKDNKLAASVVSVSGSSSI